VESLPFVESWPWVMLHISLSVVVDVSAVTAFPNPIDASSLAISTRQSSCAGWRPRGAVPPPLSPSDDLRPPPPQSRSGVSRVRKPLAPARALLGR
jgi:hypothetical protein